MEATHSSQNRSQSTHTSSSRGGEFPCGLTDGVRTRCLALLDSDGCAPWISLGLLGGGEVL